MTQVDASMLSVSLVACGPNAGAAASAREILAVKLPVSSTAGVALDHCNRAGGAFTEGLRRCTLLGSNAVQASVLNARSAMNRAICLAFFF